MPRDFRLQVFFMNLFPTSPWVSYMDRFNFFWKFAEKFAAQRAPPVSLTPVANGKNLRSEKFEIFVWTPMVNKSRYIFFFKFTLMYKQSDIVSIICQWCRWYRWCTLTCEFIREFSKKIEMKLKLFSGVLEKMIHEKTWSKKHRDTVSLMWVFITNKSTTSSFQNVNITFTATLKTLRIPLPRTEPLCMLISNYPGPDLRLWTQISHCTE